MMTGLHRHILSEKPTFRRVEARVTGHTLAMLSIGGQLTSGTVTLLAVAVVAIVYYVGRQNRAKYPPGPKPELFFGNARQIPTSMQWLKFAEWSEQYGVLPI
jgi:hypothetical protein